MILKQVTLTNFRNYASREFIFTPPTTILVGPNTVGKTNILEAVYLLSQGEALRATAEKELILFGSDWARVEGWVEAQSENSLVDVDFSVSSQVSADADVTRFEVFIENAGNTVQKVFKINNVEKKKAHFQNKLRTVVFSPESLRLVLGSPTRRRDYMNRVLSSLDFSYYHNLKEYAKVVRNRNKVLWQIKEFGVSRERLHFWDRKLFSLGEELYRGRTHFFGALNKELAKLGWGVRVEYKPSQLLKSAYKERLTEEIAKTVTSWGPHRDDFSFVQINSGKNTDQNGKARDLAVYGSRGEQREAVLALFLAELEVVSKEAGTRPLLLLDDIFSELDEKHRKKVLQVLPRQQSLVTSAEPELINSGLMDDSRVIELD